mmetsp:Transcript_25148/g.54348  ORF Transcript_25148/g.54348 Transcript_25148/m.54348 type:complete len:288 (-) Transcript_25148:217-1080(-)
MVMLFSIAVTIANDNVLRRSFQTSHCISINMDFLHIALLIAPLATRYLLRLIILLRHHHLLPVLLLLRTGTLIVPIARLLVDGRDLHPQPIRQRLAHFEQFQRVRPASVLLAELAQHVAEDHVHHAHLVLFAVVVFVVRVFRVWIKVVVLVVVISVVVFILVVGRGAGFCVFGVDLRFLVGRRLHLLGHNVRPSGKLQVFLPGKIQEEFVVRRDVDLGRTALCFILLVLTLFLTLFLRLSALGSSVLHVSIQLLLRLCHPHEQDVAPDLHGVQWRLQRVGIDRRHVL